MPATEALSEIVENEANPAKSPMPNVNFLLIFEGPVFEQQPEVFRLRMLQNQSKTGSETVLEGFKHSNLVFREKVATYWRFENFWNFLGNLHFSEIPRNFERIAKKPISN